MRLLDHEVWSPELSCDARPEAWALPPKKSMEASRGQERHENKKILCLFWLMIIYYYYYYYYYYYTDYFYYYY